MLRKFLNFDLFGDVVTFTNNGNGTLRTKFGAIISLLMVPVIIAYFIHKWTEMRNHGQIFHNDWIYRDGLAEETVYGYDDTNFSFGAFRVLSPDDWHFGDELVTLKAELWRNNTETDELISNVPIRPCVDSDFDFYYADFEDNYFADWLRRYGIGWFYCFDDPHQIQLRGHPQSLQRQFLHFYAEWGCDEEVVTSLGGGCASSEVINSFKDTTFEFEFFRPDLIYSSMDFEGNMVRKNVDYRRLLLSPELSN